LLNTQNEAFITDLDSEPASDERLAELFTPKCGGQRKMRGPALG
jgi:hypothetical protein